MIDLHVHSSHSDGLLSPKDLLQLANQHGITLLALADHDAVAGIDEATTEGASLNVQVLPAVELSVTYKRYTDVHLLGYGIDHRDPIFCERLDAFCERRDRRSEAIVDRINQRLVRQHRTIINQAEVAALADGAIGRPHIARVLLKHGHVQNMEEAFEQYLVPCDVPKEYLAMETAIDEIHRIGGVAVLAHPTSVTRDLHILEQIIVALHALGLDGLEAYNTMASAQETADLAAIAQRNGMLITGGSDFHGIEGAERMGVIRGEYSIPECCGHGLVAALANRPRFNR